MIVMRSIVRYYCGMEQNNTPKKPVPEDWHPADIVAALRKAGWSVRRLSAHHGYHPKTLNAAIDRPWPKGERYIAEAIGVPPETIWAARFAVRSERRAA